MEILCWLLWWVFVAHILADWPLQGPWIAENKGKYWIVMLAHCIAWTGFVCMPLSAFYVLVWWKIPFLLIGHYIIDTWKAKKWENKAEEVTTEEFMKYVYIDQFLHLIQLAVVCLL